MSVAFYTDVHVHRALTRTLREHGVDVLTAQEDGQQETEDSQLMDRATDLGRVMISYDQHMLQEATFRQRMGIVFPGLIFGHEQDLPGQMGLWLQALELAGIAGQPEDYACMVKYLPYVF